MQKHRTIEKSEDIVETLLHAGIINRKVFLKKLYEEFYNLFKKAIPKIPDKGILVELGSGPGFIKDVIVDVTTSDVLELPGVDRVFSALDMPFEDNSVRTIFMLNTLHHIGDVKQFLKECDRCLKIGGKLVAIEPANTFLSRFIFQSFHHEPFDPKGAWRFNSVSPLQSCNGALPWIVFSRDRGEFIKEFPSLKLLRLKLHTPFRYIISGGFSIGQLLPSVTFNAVRCVEKIVSPLNRYIGMFQTIEVVKVKR